MFIEEEQVRVTPIWAQILASLPGSRLMLKYRNWFRAGDLQTRIGAAFGALGIGVDRLDFRGGDDSAAEHLAQYRHVDVALDPYPFTGSTATFEALWMGVPVVTLAGATMMSRWSASMLRAMKLDALVADTPERYVAIARDLAADRTRLVAWRAELRGRAAASPLCDGRLRARQIERVYRAVWRRGCAKAA